MLGGVVGNSKEEEVLLNLSRIKRIITFKKSININKKMQSNPLSYIISSVL